MACRPEAKNRWKSVVKPTFDTSPIALSCYFQKFHNFLTHFHTKTYNFHAPQKSRIFDTNMQVAGNYSGRFFCPRGSLKYSSVGWTVDPPILLLTLDPCRWSMDEADNAADDRKTRSKPKNMIKKLNLKPIQPKKSMLKANLKPKSEQKWSQNMPLNPILTQTNPIVENFYVA